MIVYKIITVGLQWFCIISGVIIIIKNNGLSDDLFFDKMVSYYFIVGALQVFDSVISEAYRGKTRFQFVNRKWHLVYCRVIMIVFIVLLITRLMDLYMITMIWIYFLFWLLFSSPLVAVFISVIGSEEIYNNLKLSRTKTKEEK